jgi:hypothetical protein
LTISKRLAFLKLIALDIIKMNLKKVQLELDISDVQQVLAIALDEDKDKALEYIKARLVKQIEKVLQPH